MDQTSMKFPTKDEVEGSKKITNWADIILQMYRIPPVFQVGEWAQTDGIINLCKCRESGFLGITPVIIDAESNRISQLSERGKTAQYIWEEDYRLTKHGLSYEQGQIEQAAAADYR